ncbi:helix-turn-helix transcriptional regulator [bacterium]|nr:helix-turn-helix transcriptional regulator [bacterium]
MAGNRNKFARQCNVSESVVRKWLNEESDPSRKKVIQVAKSMDVNILWLMTGEGPVRNGTGEEPKKYQVEGEKSESDTPQGSSPDWELIGYIIEQMETKVGQRWFDTEPGKKARIIRIIYDDAMKADDSTDATVEKYADVLS